MTNNTDGGRLGGYNINQFCELFGIGRVTAYAERKAGRLKIAKIRNRSVVTHTHAEDYQALIEAEAEAAAEAKSREAS